jgi:putative transposase
MPRVARIIADNHPCHITQRGNNRQDVFLDDEDRTAYLSFLKALTEQHKVRVLGYCLMKNHVHLVVLPEKAALLAKAIGGTHFRYAQYFNKKYKRSGHLWQNRFYSAVLEEMHLVSAMRYIERNPVRVGEAVIPEQYPWSSAKAHVTGNGTGDLLDMQLWQKLVDGKHWKDVLRDEADDSAEKIIRRHTMTGRPFGPEAFIKKLEKQLDRKVSALAIGRPRKSKPEERTKHK